MTTPLHAKYTRYVREGLIPYAACFASAVRLSRTVASPAAERVRFFLAARLKMAHVATPTTASVSVEGFVGSATVNGNAVPGSVVGNSVVGKPSMADSVAVVKLEPSNARLHTRNSLAGPDRFSIGEC